MKKNTLSLFIIFSFFGEINAQTFIPEYNNVANQVTQTNITNYLTEFEGLGVKRRGTASLTNTLNWIKNKYLSYGYTNTQLFEDTYTYSGSTAAVKNLILTKVGTVYPNTFVIVCAHYDSIVGTGTNDNGSGTTILLEMARLMKNIPTEYSIKFINFSGEEDGLQGSQHYVSSVVNATNPKMNIKLVFNIDEVGGVAGMTNNTITCERDTGIPTTNNAASNTITNELITCVDLYSTLNTFLSYAYASDYMPFEDNNEVITGFFEKNESIHRHTATDLLVNMDPVYVYNIAKAGIGSLLHFAVANVAALSTSEFNSDYQVSFFPNPTKEFLTINLGILSEKEYQFQLIDTNGKVVLEKLITNPNQLEKINISDFAKGIYLAKLNAINKKISKKIVIE
ncbi:M28 family peptidase [Flavobacterium sp.]|uniref:M28 family peptidase n=1 Tax=Flavobacterium sp. TaxID=239 RepID=UPI00286E2535|nr:M28 family peptidase [Flavobacterium sp.]